MPTLLFDDYDPAQGKMRAGRVVRIDSPGPDGSVAHYGEGNRFLYRTPAPNKPLTPEEQGTEYERARAGFEAGRAKVRGPNPFVPPSFDFTPIDVGTMQNPRIQNEAAPSPSAAGPAKNPAPSPFILPDMSMAPRNSTTPSAWSQDREAKARAGRQAGNDRLAAARDLAAAGKLQISRTPSPFIRLTPEELARGASIEFPRQGSALPKGSTGYSRKAGGYTVRLADGTTRDFADEAAARAAFNPPKSGTPFLDATFSAVDKAKADLMGTRSTPPAATAPQANASASAPAAPSAEMAPGYTIKGIGQRAGQTAAYLATDQTEANPANFIDTAERYGAAAIGAAWDGNWNVPEKGLIRQGVEAALDHDPLVRNLGSAIGDATAQRRKREAIAAGRIAPDFDARAEAARRKYATPFVTPAGKALPATMAPIAPAPARPGYVRRADGIEFPEAMVRGGATRRAAQELFGRFAITPEQSAKMQAQRKDNRAGVTYRPNGMGSPAVTIPGSVLNPNMDAGALRTTSPTMRFKMGLKQQANPGVFSPFVFDRERTGARLMA